jgi:hypothetical protein
MRFIGMLIALLLAFLLAYYYATGAWPGSSADKGNPLERASKKAAVEGGPILDGKMAKERVEELLRKQEEAQKKAMEESVR